MRLDHLTTRLTTLMRAARNGGVPKDWLAETERQLRAALRELDAARRPSSRRQRATSRYERISDLHGQLVDFDLGTPHERVAAVARKVGCSQRTVWRALSATTATSTAKTRDGIGSQDLAR